MAPWPVFVLAGAGIGALTGVFGVGGSSIATPILAVLGVPPLYAVASPLLATIPAAVGAAGPYIKAGEARPRAAGWTLLGALPATVVGALLSNVVGGPTLLIASGVVPVIIGQRLLRPIEFSMRQAGTLRRKRRILLVAASGGVGLLTGLLANGGGFLLVPMYLLVFGLTMRQSAGTSLLVIAALAVPTLMTHVALGHIEWGVAGAFALGEIPMSVLSGRLAHHLEGVRVRHALGWILIVAGSVFVVSRVRGL